MGTTSRRELTDDLGILFRAALQGAVAEIWTTLPCIVKSFNPDKMTCEVTSAIKGQVTNEDGTKGWIELPLFVDCPVVFPHGGGFTLTFPLEAGDECLVVFSARCIDAWWQSGQIGIQNELRMHDLSDGFVLAGVCSVPNVVPNISTSAVQLRSDDGTAYVSIDRDGEIDITTEGSVKVVAAEADVTAPSITLTGNVVINGTLDVSELITGLDFKPSGTPPPLGTDASYLNHKHDVLHGTDLGPPVDYP